MEYEQIPTESIEESVIYKLPKWVKILFRFYAVIFLVGMIIVGIKLIHSVTTRGQELLTTVTDSMVSTSGAVVIAFFVFGLIILVLEVLYGLGVYKFKRWVLPLILTFSFSTLLIGLLRMVNLNFVGIIDLIGLLIGMSFMGLVGYASIKYWNIFTGSARKLLIQIPLLLVLLPFVVFATLSQIYTDDAEINDSDLVLQPVEILSEFDNALYSLPDIDDLSAQQQEDYEAALIYAKELEGGMILNNIEVNGHLKRTKSLTDSFIEASSKRVYQCPTLANDYGLDAPLCSLDDIRDLGVVTSMRADIEANSGNTDQAIDTGISIVRMGYLIVSSEQPILIEYLVGITLMRIGMDSLERTLEYSASATNEMLQRTADELELYILDGSSFAMSLRREYLLIKESLKSFEQFNSYFYQHNKTTNNFAEFFRRQIEVATVSCGADSLQKQEQFEAYVENERAEMGTLLFVSPNRIGKILESVTLTSLNGSVVKACETNERNQYIQKLLKEKQVIIEPTLENTDLG